MWKKYTYYFIAGFFCIALVAIEYNKPKPVNWFESYSKYDKIPYGNHILFTELPSLFSQNIYTGEKNVEESLQTFGSSTNYLFINNAFQMERGDMAELLSYVSDGKNAMIISEMIDNELLDTLGLKMDQFLSVKLNDSLKVSLRNEELNYHYNARTNLVNTAFTQHNNMECDTLGVIADTLVNFVKVPFGKGQFFLHSNPLFFTNYHMLKHDNHRYISAVLRQLPDKNLVWDEYYKNRKNAIQRSPLSIIVGTPGLRQALYILVITLLIYMVFAAKRKQRIIPVAVKKSNDTLNFVHTIGQLYYNKNNNKDIGMKRIHFFLMHVRKHYNIFHTQLDDTFCTLLHKQSGVSLDEIKKLAANFRIIKGVPEVTDERIIEQDNLIESFYKKTRYNG